MKPTDWKTQVKIFEEFGCKYRRQKGSHLIFHHPNAARPVVIPKHKEVTVSVIRNNMKTVGMTEEQYLSILNEL